MFFRDRFFLVFFVGVANRLVSVLTPGTGCDVDCMVLDVLHSIAFDLVIQRNLTNRQFLVGVLPLYYSGTEEELLG